MRFPDPGTPECWRLDTPAQTLVFASWRRHLPSIVYWGGPLPSDENLPALAESQLRPIGNAVLDFVPELSICPEEGRGFQGQPGLRLRRKDGRPVFTQFEVSDVRTDPADFCIFATDSTLPGLRLEFVFQPDERSGVVTAWTMLRGTLAADIVADWISAPVLPLPEDASDFVDYAGRWTQEFGERHIPFQRGVHLRESRRGRTGHDHFPSIIAPRPNCSLSNGQAYGIHLGWSGDHRMLVEELPAGQRQFQAGATEPQFPEDMLDDSDAFESPPIHFGWSDAGLNGLANLFQAHVRSAVLHFNDRAGPRPVHYNCWEAVYFDHRLDVLKDLADRAARIGAERFVLDDGWFGKRDDDTTSLGDWHVDRRKYPDGLAPLIEHVETLGMRFGLWVEPEMVNLDSDLARAHPDWIILPEGREPMTGRGQHVLDLTNPAVTAHLFERLDALLREYHIDYLKWDMNRDLTLPADRNGMPLLRRQVHAVYALIGRLRATHPSVEIESCASGGARIDYGILKRTHRVWLSDSNDAHERWRMQNAAMQFLPPEIVGSHVGPRHCHTSGRDLSMPFRAAVAMTGHMGFEMDLRELTPDEEATLKRYTDLYKQNRDWMHRGSQHRLPSPRPEIMAQIFVSEARDRFLVFSATMTVPQSETTGPLRLTGLEAEAKYRLRLVNAEEMSPRATRWFGSALTASDGLALSGRALMQSGIVLPLAFPDTMWLVEGVGES